MAHRSEITDELRQIGPELARLSPITPYRVPAGYFDNLAELILLRIRTEEATTAREELEMISPLLGGIGKAMPFSLPEGYFEKLTPNVQPLRQKARVISFSIGKVFKYAAAAVVAGLITVAAWFMLKSPSAPAGQYALKNDSAAEQQVHKSIGNITDTEIAAFLESNAIIGFEHSDDTEEIKDEDVRLMLADVTDQELENYLKQQNSMKEKYN